MLILCLSIGESLSETDEVRPADKSPIRTPQKLSVFPSQIQLSCQRDSQSIVAQVRYSDGITRDVTSRVSCQILDLNVAGREGNLLRAIADGSTTAQIRFGELQVDVPIVVKDAVKDPAISFQNEIVPIMSKVGCNTGSCHGAARGKDGFRLSLYGFDPEGDYFRLTREIPGRRIDLAIPEECLFISKATGQVAHGGGSPVKPDSEFHRTILRWLKEGGAKDTGPVPQVERIELYPSDGLLNGPAQPNS